MSSGLPADLILRPNDGLANVRTIAAILALAQRGLSLIKAKRTIETLVEKGEASAHVPTVENSRALSRELKAAGVRAMRVAVAPVDAKAVRTRLGLTQEQFAIRYGLEIDALQNWEQGRCHPDKPAQAYLRAIAAAPDAVAKALEQELA